MYYGYHRTSTNEQHLDRGITGLEKYAADNGIKIEKIFCDKHTGKTFDRPRYTVLKEDVLREGDVLMITECDRLGRNKKGILRELRELREKNIRIMILEIPTTLMDFSGLGNDLARLMLDTINNMLLEMFASMAQAEMEKREKRQREGIQAMKERGEWSRYGRRRVLSLAAFEKEYQRVLQKDITPTALMRELGLSSGTFYRYVGELK